VATYFVASGGSNTAPYDTWAKAATSLQTALTAASGGADVVVIQYNAVPTADQDPGAAKTYTTANHVSVVSASNDGGSAYTLTAMGTANWIGNSTNTSNIIFDGGADDKIFFWGVTFRANAANALRLVNSVVGVDITLDNCLIYLGTGAAATCTIGAALACFVRLKDCTVRFGAVGQSIRFCAVVEVVNLTVDSAGSTPTTLFLFGTGGTNVWIRGSDLSLVTGTLIGDCTQKTNALIDRCKLGSGVTVLATQSSNPTGAAGEVFLSDCYSDGTDDIFGYYNAYGSVVTETTVKTSAGAAGQSWKITTTANATFTHPFVTPWIHLYNTGTSAITPKLECVRTGSSTAYKDSEIWSEWLVKSTASSTKATFSTDRQALAAFLAGTAGTDQATGDLAAGDWASEGSPVWFGKLSPGSVTPAEPGALSARVCVGLASLAGTLYVDPQIRT
jgi:hypothetical protein